MKLSSSSFLLPLLPLLLESVLAERSYAGHCPYFTPMPRFDWEKVSRKVTEH